MLAQLAGFLPKLVKARYEENFIDRLNYQITAWLLLVFAITLSAKVCQLVTLLQLSCYTKPQKTQHDCFPKLSRNFSNTVQIL